MSRPWVLVVLLLLIVFTSQFEWKQQFGDEPEESSNDLQKRQSIGKRGDREEVVKEKGCYGYNFMDLVSKVLPEHIDTSRRLQIILSQEKKIQKLNEHVRSLREQLLQCRESEASNSTTSSFTELLNQLERQQILED